MSEKDVIWILGTAIIALLALSVVLVFIIEDHIRLLRILELSFDWYADEVNKVFKMHADERTVWCEAVANLSAPAGENV